MTTFDVTRLTVCLVFIFGILVFSFKNLFVKNKVITAKFITRSAIFAAISTLLYIVPFLKFPLPFFPGFLEIHFDEVPAMIVGFAYGPWSALFVIAVKTIIKLPLTTSMCVGELADFIYGILFIIPASIIYRKNRTFKGAALGLIIGMLIQIVGASFITSFVILNFYMYVMGLSEETIINMCKAVNPNVTSLGWAFFFWIGIPFNAFKDSLIVIITLILYKRIKWLIEKIVK